MAKQTVFVDDLTGEAGASPRTVILDGTTYEIDLTDASFMAMRESIAKYLEAGRVVKAGKPDSGRREVYQGSWTRSLLTRGWVRGPETKEVLASVQG